MRIAALVAACAATALAGCVSIEHKPLEPAGVEALRGREITIAVRELPDFAAFTPGGAVFGLVGGLAMVERGNRLVRENGVEDPALAMARTLVQELGDRFGVGATAQTVRIDTDDVQALARSLPKADLLLDMRTIGWMYSYYPTSWGRYRITYSARARLIDLKRGAVLAEGGCSRIGDDEARAPTEEELLANRAALLKTEIFAAGHACLQQLRSMSMALTGPGPALVGVPATALAAVAPSSAAPPTPNLALGPVVPLGAGGLPKEGDAWVYRLRNTGRDDAPRQRRYEVKVAAASASEIVERYAVEEGSYGEGKHAPGAYLVRLGPPVFSPYLASFQDLAARPALGQVKESEPICGPRVTACDVRASVAGPEVVEVPAGRFEAIKVTVDQRWTSRRNVQSSRQLDVWYAPAVKRAVKFSSRTMVGGARQADPDQDFELELESYLIR